MNETERLKLEGFKKKLVSNAKAIISNHVGLPLGIVKMNKIISWVEDISKLPNIDLEFFKTLYQSISHFSLGVERLECSSNFLIEQDKNLNKIISKNHNQIIEKCFEIIDNIRIEN